jgi:hypothetical protein
MRREPRNDVLAATSARPPVPKTNARSRDLPLIHRRHQLLEYPITHTNNGVTQPRRTSMFKKTFVALVAALALITSLNAGANARPHSDCEHGSAYAIPRC